MPWASSSAAFLGRLSIADWNGLSRLLAVFMKFSLAPPARASLNFAAPISIQVPETSASAMVSKRSQTDALFFVSDIFAFLCRQIRNVIPILDQQRVVQVRVQLRAGGSCRGERQLDGFILLHVCTFGGERNERQVQRDALVRLREC